jgi:hypothetical protein
MVQDGIEGPPPLVAGQSPQRTYIEVLRYVRVVGLQLLIQIERYIGVHPQVGEQFFAIIRDT